MRNRKNLNSGDYDDMKSKDEYIVEIRDLCSRNGSFSLETLSVLTSLFESLSGQPPTVGRDRFRADHHQWLDSLDAFEHKHQFLKRTEDGQSYMLNPYALPLIGVARAVSLLDIMEKIYQNLKQLYLDYLHEPIEAVTLIDNIDGYDINQKEDREGLLEGLYYLRELHRAFTGISSNFPYAVDSEVSIAESVLRNDSMGGIIMEYFKTHYAKPISPSSPDLSMLMGGDKTKMQGLIVDPGFVHHRKIQTVLMEQGTQIINQHISQISPNTPEWQKNTVIDIIYTRILIDFCKVNKIKPLEEVLLDRCGHLFCSIVKLEPNRDIYDKQRVILECKPLEGSDLNVELHVTTCRLKSTLKSNLYQQGGEFAVIAEHYELDGNRLIFHPLLIGIPYIGDVETRDLSWTRTYNNFYNIHVEYFEEFSKVKETEMPENFDEMKDIKEKVFKAALGKILSESTPKDWGGETSDFVTSHLHINGTRVRAAFLLKGPASFNPMKVKHLGTNGDQIIRLAREPADVLVVQHCHDITSAVVEMLKVFATQPSNPRHYCVIDGRESLRLLKAYNLKEWALNESKIQ